MNLNLVPNEARIIGCLMEKSVVTPDQYPLTLNALTNACNQKSGRNPVDVIRGKVLDQVLVARGLIGTGPVGCGYSQGCGLLPHPPGKVIGDHP